MLCNFPEWTPDALCAKRNRKKRREKEERHISGKKRERAKKRKGPWFLWRAREGERDA